MSGINLLEADKILVAQKFCHKGALFGHVSSGGGTIALNDNYSLKFVAKDDKFVVLELFRHAVGKTPTNQTWQKTKLIKAKKEVDSVVFKVDDKEQELF